MHSLKGCQRVGELTQAVCDEFRRRIVYEVRSHSCTRCGISQRYCATGVGEGMRCQWPNVLVPIVRGAMGSAVGMEVLRRVGFKGGFREWEEYGRWLGQRWDHSPRHGSAEAEFGRRGGHPRHRRSGGGRRVSPSTSTMAVGATEEEEPCALSRWWVTTRSYR